MFSLLRPHRLLASALALAAITQAGDYSTWGHYRLVTVNTTSMTLSADVEKIPLLVRFNAADYADMLNEASTQVQADGSDIRVTLADGTTDVPFEIEHIATGDEGALHLWILADNVAQNSATAASFRVYWGKTGETSMSDGSAVFSTTNGYQAVFHLNEASGDVTDVANGYVGIAVGTATNTAEAISGASRDFTISNTGAADPTVTSNYIHFSPGATDLLSTHTGNITMEAWVRSSIGSNSNSSPGTKTIISHKSGTEEVVWLKRNGGGPEGTPDNQFYAAGGDSTNVNGPVVPGGEADKWHYVVGTWDGTAWTVVRQRTSDGWGSPAMVRTVGGDAPVASTDPWFIGGWSDDGTASGTITRGWRGQLDEVRISTVARDSNYLELSFETSKLTPTAISIGPTEVPPPPVAGPYEDWNGHQNIVLNTSITGANVTEDVTDFPVLVRLGTAELSIIGAANGGNSIRFSKADDETPLPYEIESWSSTAAAIWVLVDTVYGDNATQFIRMHWSNGAVTSESDGEAVFALANGHRAVYHMNEATGDIADATANGNVGTNNGTTTTAGNIGAGRRFAGTNATNSNSSEGRQYIELGAPASLNFAGQITMSSWVRWLNVAPTGSGTHYRTILNRDGTSPSLETFLRIGHTSGNASQAPYATGKYAPPDVFAQSPQLASAYPDSAVWIHLAGVYDSTGPTQRIWRLYRNGVQIGVSTDHASAALTAGASMWRIGQGPVDNQQRYFSGDLDEVRIDAVTRDSNYIKLSYENQKAENSLTNIGQPVYTVPGQPTGVTAVAGDAEATVTWVAPANNGGKPIIGYIVEESNNSALNCTTTGALTCTVPGLSNGTFYTFVVKAENEVGVGPASAASTPAVVPNPPAEPAGAYDDWDGHQTITTNTKVTGANIPAEVYDFPVLVRLGAAESAILAAANGGNSIRFSKMDNATPLPYEIESWSATAAAIWVKLDTVKANDSVAAFRMHWNNAGATSESNGPAVFDTTNGFVAVYHMNEATGDLTDATGSGNTAVPSETAPRDTTGLMGGAKVFNGSTNWYQIGTDATALNLNTNDAGLTITAWVNPTSCDARIAAISKYVNGADPAGRQYSLHTGNTSTNWRFTIGSSDLIGNGDAEFYADAEGTCVTGTWKHIVGAYASAGTPTTDSAVNVQIYVDGAFMASGSTANVSGLGTDAFAYIGRIHGNERHMNGILDEITVSAVRRDSNWIKLSYESQKLMQTFTNIGMTAPSVSTAPQGVTAALGGTQGTVIVAWGAPANNGGATITKYTVTGTPSGSCESTGPLNCSITGLAPGDYSFTVTATNSAGNSAASAAATVKVPVGLLPDAFAIHMDGALTPYTYRLPTNMIGVTEMFSMTISDVRGKQVWTRTINPASNKVGEITWNGLTLKGQPVAPGMYIVRLRAQMDGKMIEAVRGSIKE